MNKIKFSHRYIKLRDIENGEKAWLLEVLEKTTNKLSKTFINYDTCKSSGGYYQLPAGRVLILLFQHIRTGRVFTTVRRWTQKKERYYTSCRGELFEALVEEDSVCCGCGFKGVCDVDGAKVDCESFRSQDKRGKNG